MFITLKVHIDHGEGKWKGEDLLLEWENELTTAKERGDGQVFEVIQDVTKKRVTNPFRK